MGLFATYTSIATLSPGFTLSAAQLSLATICLDWAESHVKNKISRRYNVGASPFLLSSTIPPEIRSITEQLALGYFFKTNSRGGKESLSRGEAFLTMGNKKLECLVKRTSYLTDTAGASISESMTVIESSTQNYYPTFAEDSPLNWLIDQDKLDDIESDRL